MREHKVYVAGGAGVSVDMLKHVFEPIDEGAFHFSSSLSALRKALGAGATPDVIIAPWSQAGMTLLGVRAALRNGSEADPFPTLLALTPTITAARIALAHGSGDVELIPTDPFDPEALRNRLIWVMQGTEALAKRYGCDTARLEELTDTMPALAKRLAA